MRIRFVTANIKAFPPMRQWKVRYVLRRLHALLLANGVAFLGTQEMWFARYRRALRAQLIDRYYGHITPRSVAGTCVAYRKAEGVAFRESGAVRLHRATPACAWRKITWAGFDLDGGHHLAVASTHFTPSAFSDRFAGEKKAVIQRAWDAGGENLREWVEDMLGAGYTHVAILCDGNAKRWRMQAALGDQIRHRAVRVFTSPATDIDHVILIGKFDIGSRGTYDVTYGDHAPFWVEATPR